MIFRRILKRFYDRRNARQIARIKASRDADFVKLKSMFTRLQRSLREQQDSHEAEMQVLRDRLAVREHSAEQVSRELELAKVEIEQLVSIIERDRRRVEAETAIHVQRIEAATSGLRVSTED